MDGDCTGKRAELEPLRVIGPRVPGCRYGHTGRVHFKCHTTSSSNVDLRALNQSRALFFLRSARNFRSSFRKPGKGGRAAVGAGGRGWVGVGGGWMREEFGGVAQRFGRRGARWDEMIEVMQELWAGGVVEHHGVFYDFDRLSMRPAPDKPVPIWVGGLSQGALRRAATLADGWISDVHSTSDLQKRVAKIIALRDDSARAGQPFSVLGAVTVAHTIDGYRLLEESVFSPIHTLPCAL